MGSIDPETRHLNLRWTIRDIDQMCWWHAGGHSVRWIAQQVNASPVEVADLIGEATKRFVTPDS